MQLPFFDNVKSAICNIYFNLISLDSQIKILFNDINHYMPTKQKTLCRTHTFFTIILSVNISYSFFNRNELNFQDMYRRYRCRELCLRSFIYVLV